MHTSGQKVTADEKHGKSAHTIEKQITILKKIQPFPTETFNLIKKSLIKKKIKLEGFKICYYFIKDLQIKFLSSGE